MPERSTVSHDDARSVVVLISAAWAGPSRPAPTILKELARRWGDRVHTLLVEDPTDEIIEQLGIEVLPTWLRLEHLGGDVTDRPETVRIQGTSTEGDDLLLAGSWTETHRRTGALPKHVIAAEFGPDSSPMRRCQVELS